MVIGAYGVMLQHAANPVEVALLEAKESAQILVHKMVETIAQEVK